jgi:hypothetical protein
MKHSIGFKLSLGALALGMAGAAAAQGASCPCGSGTRLMGGALNQALAGQTVCASRGGDRFADFHAAGGSLVAYRRGPGDPVDPTKETGRWAIEGDRANAHVVYAYGPNRYRYYVCRDGTQVHFCGLDAESRHLTGATMRAGQVACN